MSHLNPESAAAVTHHRREAIRLAHTQQNFITERSNRKQEPLPDYVFDELIGKGSFGRVYKGRQVSTKQVVAIKVLDIDEADFHAYGEQKDEQIHDFNKEIRILRQAQDSGAENLNPMIEALAVHSQLWLVCEYCPGGSVKTLMRATNDRLSEKYILIVARELAKALKGLHQAGIMHRDVKAANVLIHQEGRLQLCDFGVATVLDTRTDKRRTFIGTLHWMPPELWTENPEYSDEIDVWEYGCTLYECAVGRPPNSDLRERQQLKMRMRRLKQSISLPENENFSDGLRRLVSYALNPDVATRPSMKEILDHDYLKDTAEEHPTSILTELVQNYYGWLFSGGQRASLFLPGGAPAVTENPDKNIADDDEWNFSMTQDFERRVSAILEIPDLSDLSANDLMEGEETPKGVRHFPRYSPTQEMTAVQQANFEARVKRGADLSNLFDQSGPAYEYKTKTDFLPIPEQRRISDLPFRAMAEDRPSSIASNVIDLGEFDESDYAVAATPRIDDNIQTTYAGTPMREETIRLADPATLREKRANSKGPRDPQNQSLTARRDSSADSIPRSTAARDFAMSQEDATITKGKPPTLAEPAEIVPLRNARATMEWSFQDAMASASITTVGASDPPSPTNTTMLKPWDPETDVDEKASQQATNPRELETVFEKGAKQRATLDWSFSSAMAEASANSPSPPRRTPLTRQMTMPVQHSEYDEHAIPRPSTAMSTASDFSTTSTDIDPFGLEREDHPGPATMDSSANMGAFYSGRGRTLPGERVGVGAAARAPPVDPLDDGFPGGTITNTSSRRPSADRPTVELPPAEPPSPSALFSTATAEEMEGALARLLAGMQGTLAAAVSVVGGMNLRRDRRLEGESEWEDEE